MKSVLFHIFWNGFRWKKWLLTKIKFFLLPHRKYINEIVRYIITVDEREIKLWIHFFFQKKMLQCSASSSGRKETERTFTPKHWYFKTTTCQQSYCVCGRCWHDTDGGCADGVKLMLNLQIKMLRGTRTEQKPYGIKKIFRTSLLVNPTTVAQGFDIVYKSHSEWISGLERDTARRTSPFNTCRSSVRSPESLVTAWHLQVQEWGWVPFACYGAWQTPHPFPLSNIHLQD